MLRVLVLLMIASWSLPSSALAVQWAYVPNSGSNDVTLIDTTTNVVTAAVPVGRHPTGVAVHPSANRAYIANSGDNTLSVVDAATARVIATIPVGTFPSAVAMHRSGLFVYVTVDEGLVAINTITNTVTALVPTSGARAVAINRAGTRACVTRVSRPAFSGFCDQLAIVDISNHTPIADLTFACSLEGPALAPFGVAVDPAGVVASNVRFANPSSLAKAIELKLWLEVPGMAPVSIFNGGVRGDFLLAPGAKRAAGPLTLFTVDPATPRGDHQFDCRILDPVTAARLAQDLHPFSVR